MEIQLVPIKNIGISPKRYRKEFDPEALAELADSIQELELLHPVALRRVNGDWELAAGERRIKAANIIWDTGGSFRFNGMIVPEGLIPAVDLAQLSELEARQVEWDENYARVDLSWQESAQATAELAELRKLVAMDEGQPEPSVAVIAQERRGSSEGSNQETTRRELIVANYMADPEILKSRSLDDAYKLLKRKENLRRHEQLAKEMGPMVASSQHRLEQGNCLELMAKLPDQMFDVILTDPPYGIGADEFGDGGGAAPGGAHMYGDNPENFVYMMYEAVAALTRIAKPEAHCYIFCDIYRFENILEWLTDKGWRVFRTPMIWHKPDGNRIPWVDEGPQRKHEYILYAQRGRKKVQRLGGDVLTYPADTYLGVQAQKPVALFVDLLKRSCQPGDTVLDPFCGSGTIFPAAHEAKVRATGFEVSAAAYGIAAQRLKELK